MENTFPNRRWLILDAALTASLDFNQITQTSVDALRFNADRTKFIIKYDVEIVDTPYNIHHIDAETGEEFTEVVEAGVTNRPDVYSPGMTEYTYEEILAIMDTPEWSPFIGENLG